MWHASVRSSRSSVFLSGLCFGRARGMLDINGTLEVSDSARYHGCCQLEAVCLSRPCVPRLMRWLDTQLEFVFQRMQALFCKSLRRTSGLPEEAFCKPSVPRGSTASHASACLVRCPLNVTPSRCAAVSLPRCSDPRRLPASAMCPAEPRTLCAASGLHGCGFGCALA